MSPDADAVEAARRIRPIKTPEQTAAAILRAYERAQGKHPRSHTMADYNRLAHRLAPIIARALLSIREEMEGVKKGLEYYADQLCEGWCKEAGGFFDDCGGCPARRSLSSLPGDW